VSYAPAMIACWAMVLFLIIRQDRLTFEHLLLLAVLAGALEAFFDMMISIPLTASIYLIVAGTLVALRSSSVRNALASMLGLTAAWSFGLGGSYLAKLLLTSAVLGWQAVFQPFLTQLQFRVGTVDPEAHLPKDASWGGMIFNNIDRLSGESARLGFDNTEPELTSAYFTAFALIGWGYALWQLFVARRQHRAGLVWIAGAGYLAATVFVLVWVAAFPEHTWRHAWITVRTTTIWIAAGWGWALTARVMQSAVAATAPAPVPDTNAPVVSEAA